MESCLFCKIIAREILAEIIYEDNATLAVMDIHPRSSGHAFVIPKIHYVILAEVPDAEIGPLFVAVRNTVIKINAALHSDGFTIGINHGRAAGQEIDHLHIHIIPRWDGDGGSSIQSVAHNPSTESVAEIAEKIRIMMIR